MFKTVKSQVQDSFNKLVSLSPILFYVDIDRDLVFEKYLQAFEESEQQGHNCNSCKSFLRQYAGIVRIIDNKRVSIWDNIDADEEYNPSITALKEYIHSLPITNVFFNEFAKCGTDKNLDSVRNVTWEHFFITLPKEFVKKADKIDSLRGELRTNKELLLRSLQELTQDSVQTVLDLIAQGSLYRGNEFKNILTEYQKVQKDFDLLVKQDYHADKEQNFAWVTSMKVGPTLCRIRNTAIGTLLIDLSEGMDLDGAVTKFERVVAPTNYKRPTALVTPAMIESAKTKLAEMGLTGSLERRFANETDLSVEDIIYTDKTSSVTDVFGEMSKESVINPKTFSKVEEISVKDFIEKIVPTSNSIEVLMENSHKPNLVSIITGIDNTAKSLFKWDNLFSWSYTGGITDSMKERVKEAGGKVDGVLRCSIQWNDEDTKGMLDFDAHVIEPGGSEIYYASKISYTSRGMLDVDMINPAKIGVENITWADKSRMKDGEYKFFIRNYNGGRNTGFKAQVEFDGEIYDFAHNQHVSGDIHIAIITLKNGVFSIKSLMNSTSQIGSNTFWGIKTNQFTKVRKIMLSPNHWGSQTGNKHYMFLLDECISDESPRPFFNEFLKQEFDENRKVFEILGSKVKVEATDNQLSGLGFSETQKNHLFVRVGGSFKRVLKVNF